MRWTVADARHLISWLPGEQETPLNFHGFCFLSEYLLYIRTVLILVAILFLGQGLKTFQHLLKEDKTLFFLPIALIAGIIVGPVALHTFVLTVVFGTAFEPILAYFLFEMGRQAGSNLRNLGRSSWTLVRFGIGMPLLGGTVGAILAYLASFSLGDAMIFSTLAASASYVAAPTAMGAAITALHKMNPEKAGEAVSTSLTVSLGITLPFNIAFGLPLYLWQAQAFKRPGFLILGISAVLIVILTMVTWRKWLWLRLWFVQLTTSTVRMTIARSRSTTIHLWGLLFVIFPVALFEAIFQTQPDMVNTFPLLSKESALNFFSEEVFLSWLNMGFRELCK